MDFLIKSLPNRQLCSFLLVSKDNRSKALAECKRRSPFPHLWDIDWNTLVLSLHRSDNYLLGESIHADYCLCAYTGFFTSGGIRIHMSEDLYFATKNRMPISNAHLFRAACFGLEVVCADIITSNPNINPAEVQFSVNPNICEPFKGCEDLYRFIWTRDFESIRALGTLHLPRFALISVVAWLVHRRDIKMINALRSKIKKFDTQLSREVSIMEFAPDLATEYHWPGCHDKIVRTREHLVDVLTDRGLSLIDPPIIGVDDPLILEGVKDAPQDRFAGMRHSSSRNIVAILRRSLCNKMLASLGHPPVSESWEGNLTGYDFVTASTQLALAMVRTAKPAYIAELVMCEQEQTILALPGGKGIIHEALKEATAYYTQSVEKYLP